MRGRASPFARWRHLADGAMIERPDDGRPSLRTIRLAAFAALAFPAMAAAQPAQRALTPCDEASAGLAQLAPGAGNEGVRSFYEGRVTLLRLDYVEPACCAWGVAVLMPDGDGETEPAGTACWATWGYAGVDLQATTSRYDPAEGLTLTIPTRAYDHDTGGTRAGEPIRLRINASGGTIVDLGAGGS